MGLAGHDSQFVKERRQYHCVWAAGLANSPISGGELGSVPLGPQASAGYHNVSTKPQGPSDPPRRRPLCRAFHGRVLSQGGFTHRAKEGNNAHKGSNLSPSLLNPAKAGLPSNIFDLIFLVRVAHCQSAQPIQELAAEHQRDCEVERRRNSKHASTSIFDSFHFRLNLT